MEYAKLRLGKRGEGVRLQEGLELNISLRNPLPPKLSKPPLSLNSQGQRRVCALKFSSVYQRESCRTFYDRNFQEFPNTLGYSVITKSLLHRKLC